MKISAGAPERSFQLCLLQLSFLRAFWRRASRRWKDARHSNFRYRWFRARSQSLPSLGAFGGLVLVWQACQSGTFSSVFCNLHFCACFRCELVGARKNARHSNFRYCWFLVSSQSLPSLGAFGGMVLVRQARQSGTFSSVFCNSHFCGAMA